MKKLIILFILLLSVNAWGATYYMRHDGTAANKAAASGPCSTQANCMSVATHNTEGASGFSAGDIIIACDDGGDYVGTTALLLDSSGSNGSPITIQGESGGSPKFYGSKTVAGWALSGDCGGECTNTYEITEDNSGYDVCVGLGHFAVFEDERFLVWQANVAAVEANAGSCFYDTGNNEMYVHSFDSDNPGTNGYTYRATQLYSPIHINGAKSYITIEDLDFYYTSSYPVQPFLVDEGTIYTPDNIIYDNLTVFASRHGGFGALGTNFTIQNCTASHNYGQFAFAVDSNGATQDNRSENLTIKDCIVQTSTHFDDYAACYISGLLVEGDPLTVTVSNINMTAKLYRGIQFATHENEHEATTFNISKIDLNHVTYPVDFNSAAEAVTISALNMNEQPLSHGIALGASTNTIIKNSFLRGSSEDDKYIISSESGSGAKVHNNILIDFTAGTVGVGVYAGDTISNIYIYNNDFYNGDYGIVSDADGGGLYLKNNIFHTVVSPTYLDTANDFTESDYNLFYTYTSFGGLTFAQWQSLGFGANSIDGQDPLFTNAGSDDFSLKPGSPCRHGGDPSLTSYTAKLRPETSWPSSVTTMEDILSIGAYGIYRGSAGM